MKAATGRQQATTKNVKDFKWSQRPELNRRPTDYELSRALLFSMI